MRGRLYAGVGESRRLESGFAVLESGEPWGLLPTLPSRMELGADGAQGKSLLTTQDIILCKRGSEIWRSQTTETEGAQRLESVVMSRDRKLGGRGLTSLDLDCN